MISLDRTACAGGILRRGQEGGAGRSRNNGQALRRTRDAKDPGPSGCVPAGARGVAVLDRISYTLLARRYAAAIDPGGSPRRNATQAASPPENQAPWHFSSP